MQFEPVGGFPPIVRIDDIKVDPSTLEIRGFASTNLVNIKDIITTQKKKNVFMSMDNDSETGFNVDSFLHKKPKEYSKISYKENI